VSETPFNGLSPAEAERLYMLAEEAGEIVQAIGKVLRHGYWSRHPDGGPTNRDSLERELGDLLGVMRHMCNCRDLTLGYIENRAGGKMTRAAPYMHHLGDILKDDPSHDPR
jgi:NTP pyrophosphatase (non-canonical NTP hydrolase)